MEAFLQNWHQSAVTTAGLFWMALWAFALGYLISAMVQVFITKERMRKSMGQSGPKSIALGTFFGFLSSSCSFAALATTRSLFAKGASFASALAFLLASTNLVVELGIVIAVFLGWQFVVGEYLGGLLLILLSWLLIRLTLSRKLEKHARQQAEKTSNEQTSSDSSDWKRLIKSREGWQKVAKRYVMEWQMVWKDVAVGFTVAGIIAVFVPATFFTTLFIGSGSDNPAFWQIVFQAFIGPVAAFFTFIGSMGNIPLAAVLFGHGVSFAGVMAFIFSDLVVLPVLRIQARYYGWKVALYIMAIFLIALVITAVTMHYGFAAAGLLPTAEATKTVTEREFFKVDYTLWFNIIFLLLSGVFFCWYRRAMKKSQHNHDHGSNGRTSEKVLRVLAILAFGWLLIGFLLGVIL
ncbi:permease [Arsukibacterium sp.]|uniref:permease n=1 Tax=Arsukibacterium sp. TaxID=1977258 RepID=UPI00299D532F|nr:permease [Arsukibacterium sp.]MDX1678922.1 permease [Arsukibacterium sp.]